MKRCPECRRDYYDDSLLYCLDDGSALLEGPAQGSDEPRTEILHRSETPGDGATKAKMYSSGTPDVLPTAPAGRTAIPWKVVFLVAFVSACSAAGVFTYRSYRSGGSETINSIAVLPFENRSGAPDTDYLSDGLTDSLIFRFSQLPNLKVSPTSSVMRYKGTAKDVADIAKELDVDGVLSGRLTQIGDNLSISVQLIDARTKKLVWAEQYDRKMADLLATQREIATTLTQKMQLRLAGNETGISKKYTSISEAYQLYLKGRYHWSKRTKVDLDRSVESFKAAIGLDPNFALAYVGMAEAYNSMAKDPDVAPKDAVPFAKSASTRALELDPSLPDAHSAFGDSLAIYDWNWAESEQEFHRALELDPNISYIHLAYSGSYLGPSGKTDDAVKQAEKAVELEPLSLINNSVLASAYVYDRQYDKAMVQARKTLELDKDFPLVRQWVGMIYILQGQPEKAIEFEQKTPQDSPARWTAVMVIAHAYAKMGNRPECEKAIRELEEIGKTRYVRRYYIASIYATLGDKDRAFVEMEKAFTDRDSFLARSTEDPFMDPLRGDSRFEDLLKRMNLAEK
jgi:TolB-like protein/predicted Zn-dependent protease